MGIPFYFKYLCKKHPECILDLKTFQDTFSINELYFDLNGLIHPSVRTILNHPRGKLSIENQMANQVLEDVSKIIDIARPKHLVGLYVDGVAPFAKITQQRSRRYKSVKMRERINSIREKYGKEKDNWDTNMISPGTPFMNFLMTHIENNIELLAKKHKIAIDFSGSNEPGEGEQKIMKTLRDTPTQIEKENIVIYGLDADLIMLSLLHSHSNKNIFLLREDTSKKENDKVSYLILNINELRRVIYLEVEDHYRGNFHYTQEAIIRDYVVLCFLVGNDFLPNLMMLNIDKDDINFLLDLYTKCLSRYKKHLVSNNSIHFDILLELLKELQKKEHSNLLSLHHNYVKRKFHLSHSNQQSAYEKEIHKLEYEPIMKRETMKLNEKDWRYHYYRYGLHQPIIDRKDIEGMSHQYLEGLNWVLKYYTEGCPSWGWHYNYGCSPLVEDLYQYLSAHPHPSIDLIEGIPLSPSQQLLSILPRETLDKIPRLRDKYRDMEYLYPIEFPSYGYYHTYNHQTYALLPSIHYHMMRSIHV